MTCCYTRQQHHECRDHNLWGCCVVAGNKVWQHVSLLCMLCGQVCWVPGSFELPVVAKAMAKSGKFDAVVCIGVVVSASTKHSWPADISCCMLQLPGSLSQQQRLLAYVLTKHAALLKRVQVVHAASKVLEQDTTGSCYGGADTPAWS